MLEGRKELLSYTLPPMEQLYAMNQPGEEITVLSTPQPDELVKPTDPLLEWPGLVLPAMDRLVEQGIADPDRFGLMGHRYGGYAVNCLVTQTDRFRAAVSISGVSDLVSDYLSQEMSGSILWYGQGAEDPEGRPRTLWGERERFLANSPVLYLDRVTTPLLLLHGEQGADAVPEQSRWMFRGLRRLGKPVSLVIYPKAEDGEVGATTPGDRVDAWARIIEWFGRYL